MAFGLTQLRCRQTGLSSMVEYSRFVCDLTMEWHRSKEYILVFQHIAQHKDHSPRVY